MAQASPVLIVGMPRCGTYLLYRLLQRHSSFRPVHCTGEEGLDLTETFVFLHPLNGLRHPNGRAFFLDDESAFGEFQSLTAPIVERMQSWYGRMLVGPKRRWAKLFKTARWKASGAVDLTRAFFHFAQQARGCKRLLEKTPGHYQALGEIRATFPRAKMLFLYRHPVDAYTSYHRRYLAARDLGRPEQEIAWMNTHPRRFCRDYARGVSAALAEAAAHPEDTLLASYENLVADPEGQLRNILDFVGESFEPAMIPKVEGATRHAEDPHLYGAVRRVTKDWSAFTTVEAAHTIEKRLRPHLNALSIPSKFA